VGREAAVGLSTAGADDLPRRRHLLFTMLTVCAWRDSPAGAPPVVAGLRTFLGGWLGIGRIVEDNAHRHGRAGWSGTGGQQ
jgi:hypothetical protein